MPLITVWLEVEYDDACGLGLGAENCVGTRSNNTGSADLKNSIAAIFDAAGLKDARAQELRRTFASIAAATTQSGYPALCGDLRTWPAIGGLFCFQLAVSLFLSAH